MKCKRSTFFLYKPHLACSYVYLNILLTDKINDRKVLIVKLDAWLTVDFHVLLLPPHVT